MKQLAFCFYLALAFVSCSENPPSLPRGFVERTLCLTDSFSRKNLAQIQLVVPVEFDTLLSWIDWNDAGGEQKYRFVNSKGCLIQESGFFKSSYCRDSIQRLTIEHQLGSVEAGFAIDTSLINRVGKKLESKSDLFGAPLKWKNKGIQKINSCDYAVFHYIGANYFANDIEIFEAITLVESGYIAFRLECAGFDCSDFSRKAWQTLASIQIDTICGR